MALPSSALPAAFHGACSCRCGAASHTPPIEFGEGIGVGLPHQGMSLQEGGKQLSSPLQPTDDSAQPVDWVMTTLLFLFPAILGGCFGYDIGASSGALISLTDKVKSGTDW